MNEDCHEKLPVAAARDGRPEAWEALFQRFGLPLYAYIYRCILDEQASLDIVQETLINAVKHLRQLKDDQKFGSWLFGIAHQRIIQHWRKRTSDEAKLRQFHENLESSEENPLQSLIRHEDETWFLECLDALGPAHRTVLLLHFIEGFKLDEIAEITRTRSGTVKSRLFYAKKALAKLLKGDRP